MNKSFKILLIISLALITIDFLLHFTYYPMFMVIPGVGYIILLVLIIIKLISGIKKNEKTIWKLYYYLGLVSIFLISTGKFLYETAIIDHHLIYKIGLYLLTISFLPLLIYKTIKIKRNLKLKYILLTTGTIFFIIFSFIYSNLIKQIRQNNAQLRILKIDSLKTQNYNIENFKRENDSLYTLNFTSQNSNLKSLESKRIDIIQKIDTLTDYLSKKERIFGLEYYPRGIREDIFELSFLIRDYKDNSINSFQYIPDSTKTYFGEKIDLGDVLDKDNTIDHWEFYYFTDLPVNTILTNLNNLKFNIYKYENEFLKTINKESILIKTETIKQVLK